MKTRSRNAWSTLLWVGFVWAWAACMFPTFPAPAEGPPGVGSPTNNPAVSTSYKVVTNYLKELIDLVAITRVYDVFIDPDDGVTYHARTGDVDDVVASSTDIGALVNTLWTGGGVAVRLKSMGTYNSKTPIVAPSNNVRLFGMGPGTVIKAAASASWTAGSSHAAGSFMFDCYNAGAGRKWVMCQDVWFDCNSLAEGGARYCGLVSDTTQWNMFFRNFVANFKVVGFLVEDQSTAGGTRQHIDYNKIGPGASGVPTRGLEIRCNDIHPNENDIFGVSDVGIYISKRGSLVDKSCGSWFIEGGHVAVGNYQGGGLSPDTQPVNVLIDCTFGSGEIDRLYIDNIKRYGVYCKPVGGHQENFALRNSWFNGRSFVDASGSDKGVALVMDQSAGGVIYGTQFVGNRAGTAKTGSNPTAGVFRAMVALIGGMLPGNYVSMDHNKFRGCLNFWDPNGARPDLVGADNWQQPSAQNTGQGAFAAGSGLFTTLQNIADNPTLTVDANADNIPDLWTNQNIGSAGSSASYAGGDWQLVATSINQLIYQNVPCVAGKVYSVSADVSVIAGGGAAAGKLAILFLDETGTQVGAGSSTTGPTGTGGYNNVAVNNKTAPSDDGHSGGTVDTVAGTAAIVAKTGTFPNDLVNTFVIPGAGAAGADLVTKIDTYTDATHVTLHVAPSATLTDASWIAYGHGDAVVFQVSLKNVSPNNTLKWKNVIVAQDVNTAGQSGAHTSWTIKHGLGGVPAFVDLTPANSVAAGASSYVSAVDGTLITVTTTSVTGPSWYWRAAV